MHMLTKFIFVLTSLILALMVKLKRLKLIVIVESLKTELFEKSIKDLKVDVKSSWMIGDRTLRYSGWKKKFH